MIQEEVFTIVSKYCIVRTQAKNIRTAKAMHTVFCILSFTFYLDSMHNAFNQKLHISLLHLVSLR